MTEVERYLASVEARVHGAGASRLCAELRDHLDDAIAHLRRLRVGIRSLRRALHSNEPGRQ